MATREFEIFLVRYFGHELSDSFVNIAICVSEVSDRDGRYVACECTEEWDQLEDLFPNADIDFLKSWCAALLNDFCTPGTNRLSGERLKRCSSHIDVSVSRRTAAIADERYEPMEEVIQLQLN